MVTIMAKIVTKLDREKYTTRVNVVIPRTSYTTLVATDRERLGFTGQNKWSGIVATGL